MSELHPNRNERFCSNKRESNINSILSCPHKRKKASNRPIGASKPLLLRRMPNNDRPRLSKPCDFERTMENHLNEVPSVILALIESYLPPSSIVSLTMTCTKFHKRWTKLRWRKTFNLHYGIMGHPQDLSRKRSSSAAKLSPLNSPELFSSPSPQDGYHRFYKERYGSWEKSFVCEECDVDECCNPSYDLQDDDNFANTKFNHKSLLPSLKRYYKSLWYKIELSMLGLEISSTDDTFENDRIIRNIEHGRNQLFGGTMNRRYLPRQRRHNCTAVAVVAKLIQMLFSPLIEYIAIVMFSKSDFFGWKIRRNFHRTKEDVMFSESSPNMQNAKKLNSNHHCAARNFQHTSSNLYTMNAWKIACLLKEEGINCIRCRLCDEIDVVGNDKNDLVAWITPCRCLEPVHRKCLEEKLGLVQSMHIVEYVKQVKRKWISRKLNYRSYDDFTLQITPEAIAPKIWVSYDEPFPNHHDHTNGDTNAANLSSPAKVDEHNKFTSTSAKCSRCGVKYSRALRLPRTIPEVIFASLSDKLAILRAFSTLAHFLLCIGFISAVEAKCSDEEDCTNLMNISPLKSVVLKWPTSTWKGMALGWWQLQQCCMLHIFFSSRFVAIVDRLWVHSGSTFYVKLYVYFVCSTILLMFFIPSVSRKVNRDVLCIILNEKMKSYLSPLWDAILFCNLCQYAISSTTVIIIFWRTNYRMYTVAERKDAKLRSLQLRPHPWVLEANIMDQSLVTVDHPIYHGRWQ